MSLRKIHISKMEPIKGDHYRDHKDEVAYTSVNDARKTSFAAVTAPNSQHAARLARLAMLVQNQQESREPKSRIPTLPSSSSSTHPRLEHSIEKTRTKPRRVSSAEAQGAATITHGTVANPMPATHIPSQHHGSSSYAYLPREPPACVPTAPAPMPLYSEVPEQPYLVAQMPAPQLPETRMEFVEGLGYVEVEVQAEEYAPNQSEHQVARPMSTRYMAPEVTKYITDSKMGYKVKGDNGKIEVSAPHASTEAWMFDEFAKLNSKPSQENGVEGRLVKTKHHSSSHSGGSFWKWVTQ